MRMGWNNPGMEGEVVRLVGASARESVTPEGQKALSYAETFVERYPGRGSATQVETAAAFWVHSQLHGLNINNLWIQSFSGLRTLWFFQALVFGMAIVGHLAFALLRPPLGDLPAWIVSTAAFFVSGWMLWQRSRFQELPLRTFLPHGPSQNVVAVLPPKAEVLHKVVLVAHLDSARAIIWYILDLLHTLYTCLTTLSVAGLGVASVCYALSLLNGLDAFAWIGAGFSVIHFFAWFNGVTVDLGAYSPGTNSNASGVGVLLALAERLHQYPLQNTEVWLAFTGCAESGGDGMRNLLAKSGAELKHALWIDVESVGIGHGLAYLQTEGLFPRRRISRRVEKLLKTVPQPVKSTRELLPVNGYTLGLTTETSMIWAHELEGVCLITMPQAASSSLKRTYIPEYRGLTDIPGKLEVSALSRACSFIWDLLMVKDQEGEMQDNGWGRQPGR